MKDCPIGNANHCSQRFGEQCMMACTRCYMLDKASNNDTKVTEKINE